MGQKWLLDGGSLAEVDVERGNRRADATTMLLLALPGSTYLYQGEELGLHEVGISPMRTARIQPTSGAPGSILGVMVAAFHFPGWPMRRDMVLALRSHTSLSQTGLPTMPWM